MIPDLLMPTPTAKVGQHLRGPRLRMKPPGSPRGSFDGGWWPRSNDLASEFAVLAPELAAWVGPVARVSYHLDTWGKIPRKVPVQGRIVRFGGFRSMNPHIVDVLGSTSRRISLLVVPPPTPDGSGQDSADRVEDLLTRNGLHAGDLPEEQVAPHTGLTEQDAAQRWESEGGPVAAAT